MLFYSIVGFIIISAALSFRLKKLTIYAAIAGGLIAYLLFLTGNFTLLAILAVFFVLGSLSTNWKFRLKDSLGVQEANRGRRDIKQVLANAGVAGVLSIVALLYPENRELFNLMIAASFASSLSDTLSSELGNLYGTKFYNIFTLKKDIRGLDGVISLEGTLFGFAGSAVIALIYSIGYGWSYYFYAILISGILGNLFDSLLGSVLERKKMMGNNAVNFLNNVFAATVAYLFF